MLSRNTDLALEKLREETYKSLERDREACHLSTERLNDRVTANLMLVQGNYVTTAAMESLKADIRNQFNGFRDDMRTMFKNSRTDV